MVAGECPPLMYFLASGPTSVATLIDTSGTGGVPTALVTGTAGHCIVSVPIDTVTVTVGYAITTTINLLAAPIVGPYYVAYYPLGSAPAAAATVTSASIIITINPTVPIGTNAAPMFALASGTGKQAISTMYYNFQVPLNAMATSTGLSLTSCPMLDYYIVDAASPTKFMTSATTPTKFFTTSTTSCFVSY
jgi:hypothetical protein